MQPQQVAHLVIGFHLSDLLLHQLVIRDASAKRFARVCVCNRVMRLNRVDFPTFGLPTITTVGNGLEDGMELP